MRWGLVVPALLSVTLYDPMYFTGGYAIHGNPSVPPYPASHRCIRVPYGETVCVH